MSQILSLHSYWMLNGAIVLSYLVVQAILKDYVLRSQVQQLQFARRGFVATIAIFFLCQL